jgi:mannose-1-phosphate guanylyltransferase
MFVWKARTFLQCVQRFEPKVYGGVRRIAEAWDTADRRPTLEAVYPRLTKISVDYGVMEPASADPGIPLLAVPMTLHWRDVGSWSSYAEACTTDERGNAVPSGKSTLVDCTGILAACDEPRHLIAAIGCEDLIIVHTKNATLVCPKARAQDVKDLQSRILAAFGEDYS